MGTFTLSERRPKYLKTGTRSVIRGSCTRVAAIIPWEDGTFKVVDEAYHVFLNSVFIGFRGTTSDEIDAILNASTLGGYATEEAAFAATCELYSDRRAADERRWYITMSYLHPEATRETLREAKDALSTGEVKTVTEYLDIVKLDMALAANQMETITECLTVKREPALAI